MGGSLYHSKLLSNEHGQILSHYYLIPPPLLLPNKPDGKKLNVVCTAAVVCVHALVIVTIEFVQLNRLMRRGFLVGNSLNFFTKTDDPHPGIHQEGHVIILQVESVHFVADRKWPNVHLVRESS